MWQRLISALQVPRCVSVCVVSEGLLHWCGMSPRDEFSLLFLGAYMSALEGRPWELLALGCISDLSVFVPNDDIHKAGWWQDGFWLGFTNRMHAGQGLSLYVFRPRALR